MSIISLQSCDTFAFRETKGSTVVANVDDHKLYLKDVIGLDVEGLNYVDSLDIINVYAKEWLRNRVIEQYAAKKYTKMKNEVEKLVDDYRRSLYTHYFEKDYTQNLKVNVTEDDINRYYDENRSTFVLTDNIVKARVVVVSNKYSDIRTLRRKFKSTRSEEYTDIKSLAERDDFTEREMSDQWYSFSDVLKMLPFPKEKMDAMLKKDGVYEFKDDNDIFFVRIISRKLKGTIAPRDVVRNMIHTTISVDRKRKYLESVRDSLYYTAIRKGEAKYNLL